MNYANYMDMFPETEISEGTFRRAMRAGLVIDEATGALHPRNLSLAQGPSEEDDEPEGLVGLTFSLAGPLAAASAELSAVIEALGGFDIRDVDHDGAVEVTETFRFGAGEWTATMPSIVDNTHTVVTADTEAEVDPLTAEVRGNVLRLWAGHDVFRRMSRRITDFDGFAVGSANWRSAMARAVRFQMTALLADAECEDAEVLASIAERTSGETDIAAATAANDMRMAAWAALAAGSAQDPDILAKWRKSVSADTMCPRTWYNRWGVGAVEGLTLDRAAQADLDRRPLDEQAEGAAAHPELAARDNGDASGVANVFSMMFEKTGERKAFSDERLYWLRCANERIETEAKMLNWLIGASKADISAYAERLEERYKGAVKAAAPGPAKANVTALCAAAARGDEISARMLCDVRQLGWLPRGQVAGWTSAPLYGAAALEWLRKNTSAEFKAGKRVNIGALRVVIAPRWEHLWLKGDQWRRVRETMERRLRSDWNGFAGHNVRRVRATMRRRVELARATTGQKLGTTPVGLPANQPATATVVAEQNR